MGAQISTERLQAIVERYAQDEPFRQAEARWWRAEDMTVVAAVRRAALAITEHGVMHSHQRRPGAATMRLCADALATKTAEIGSCSCFEQLFQLIDQTLKDVPGAGEMVVYDTTDRIALHLGLEPEFVYLHAGTREGARALEEIGRGERKVERSRFHPPLDDLPARWLEDILCHHKDEFAGGPPKDEGSCHPRRRRRRC